MQPVTPEKSSNPKKSLLQSLLLGTKNWTAKINEDRSAIYKRHPGAIRLVGGRVCVGHPTRTVDPDYDVQPRRKIQKIEHSIWDFVPLLVLPGLMVCGSLLVGYEIINPKDIAKLFNDWGPLFVLGCFGIGIPLAIYHIFADSQERRIEMAFKRNGFLSRWGKSKFYLYHDHLLEELGFKKLETGLRTKYELSLFYLSPSGNLLVELVQVGSGRDYFSLATVTNDGKFLETHSLVTPRQEKRDVNLRWQRQSANHEDIIKALNDHDRLVEEFTRGGSVQEAQFTEERIERFLRWGAEKNAT